MSPDGSFAVWTQARPAPASTLTVSIGIREDFDMRTRTWTALVAAVSLGLTACGGDDGGGALSEDAFVDALADVCDDVSRDLDRLDLPTDDDFSDFGREAADILTGGVEQLQALAAPDELAKDFERFVATIEDQVKVAEDLADTRGSNEVASALGDLEELSADQSRFAEDLGVDECNPQADDQSADTTTTAAAVEATVAPTLPPTTAAPITLPSTVAPTVPATPAPTDAPLPPTTNFAVVDLTTLFVAPDGFYLVGSTPDQATIDLIASKPELNEKLLEIGVATLVESGTDRDIADVWLGISRTDSMPADWKDIDCPNGGDLRSSASGVLGIVCYGALESPVWEIFTATDADIGISVYTLVSDVPGDLVADAFLLANP